MELYPFLLHIHSGLRWLLILALLIAIFKAIAGKFYKSYSVGTGANRFAMIMAHLQIIAGFVIYFISPKVVFSASAMKDSILRFYLVEHILMMIIAIALITIGFLRFKRVTSYDKKINSILVYYTIGLLLILAAIPWPFRFPGTGWF